MLNLVDTWQGGVCLAFADEVLCWLYGTVKESEILNFMNLFIFLFVIDRLLGKCSFLLPFSPCWLSLLSTTFHIQIITFWLFGIRWRLHIAVCSAFQPFRASTSTVLPCWDYQSCWAVITNQRDPANYTWFEGAPVLTRQG